MKGAGDGARGTRRRAEGGGRRAQGEMQVQDVLSRAAEADLLAVGATGGVRVASVVHLALQRRGGAEVQTSAGVQIIRGDRGGTRGGRG